MDEYSVFQEESAFRNDSDLPIGMSAHATGAPVSPIQDIETLGRIHTAQRAPAKTGATVAPAPNALSSASDPLAGAPDDGVMSDQVSPFTSERAATRTAPLVPGYTLDGKRGVASPQPIAQRNLVRAESTGRSDSDTDNGTGNESAGNSSQTQGRASSRAQQPQTSPPLSSPGKQQATGLSLTPDEEEDEQLFIDEFGFVIDEEAKERDMRFVRKVNGRQVVRREIKWANMATNWERTNTKIHGKLKERCRKGIPARFRGVAWQLLLGSHAQIESPENAGVYVALRDKRLADRDVDPVISRDLARTFPNHVLFQDEGGVGQTFLKNVLHAYAGSDPEVGYVQGMGFIVGALSTQMGEEESFWALHEMMYNERYKMRELFKPGFPLLQQFFYQFKRLLARLLPKLSKYFTELNVEPSFYASQWFLTLFVYHFPFRALLRVWDVFFCEGWKIVFRTGLALMQWEEKRLLSLPFEELLPALKNLQDGKDARELLRLAHRVKFKTALLNRYGDEYWQTVGRGGAASSAQN